MRPSVQQPISKDKNVMARTRKYYLKKHYLTMRQTTFYPHTKYHWPFSKKTIIWPWGQSPTKVIMVHDTPPYGHAPTYQISLTHLERNNYLTLRSRSHEGHYGTRHTALWSCTHIRNIIDLSWKTKKLWSGQASLSRSGSGRSGRKNQTKTICLPSFEGET